MASPLSAAQRFPIGVRWLLLVAVMSLSGCSMCQSDFDHYYAAYGGRRPRADMVLGRVGSILDPAPETQYSVPMDVAPVESADGTELPTAADAPLFDPSDSFWNGELPAEPETPDVP